MKKIIYGILIVLIAFLFVSVSKVNAVTNPTPSTNDANKGKGWAYVEQLTKGVGTTDLKFTSTRAFYSCFEYRSDNEPNTVAGANPNTAITDGRWKQVCVNNSQTTKAVSAKEFVDVRMVYGAETDERFTWTRFDVLPPPTCAEQIAAGTWTGEHECGWSPIPWSPGPYAPASCGGIFPTIPLLQKAERVNENTINLGWWPVGNASKYSLVYGYIGENMIHGISKIDRNVTGLNVSALRANTKTQFELWAWNGECVSKSKIFLSN